MRILAWDPGELGAFAYHNGDRVYVMRNNSLETEEAVLGYLERVIPQTDIFVFESQTFCGGTWTSAPAMGAFGNGYGFIRGCVRSIKLLRCLPLRTEPVRPQEWMASVKAERPEKVKKPSKKGLNEKELVDHMMKCRSIDKANQKVKAEWKRRLRDEAQSCFPGLKMTLEICDAILLLRYAIGRFK